MRLLIAAVGRLKQGPERELAAAYRKRAEAIGRGFGLRDIEIVEIRESRAQDAERRRIEESIAIDSSMRRRSASCARLSRISTISISRRPKPRPIASARLR